MKKTILCYGDSNTWGYMPASGERFGEDVRWPRVMAALLGEDYAVVEAGLTGRTSTWDDPWDACLNGQTLLEPVLRMAAPLDLVILMLGTNDLKFHTAWESAGACNALIARIRQNNALFANGKPAVLWVAPPLISPTCSLLMAEPGSTRNHGESLKFGPYFKQLAAAGEIPFFDAASVAQVEDGPHADGAHLGKAGHRKLGTALAKEVRKLI